MNPTNSCSMWGHTLIEKNGLIDEEEMIEHLKAKGLWLI